MRVDLLIIAVAGVVARELLSPKQLNRVPAKAHCAVPAPRKRRSSAPTRREAKDSCVAACRSTKPSSLMVAKRR